MQGGDVVDDPVITDEPPRTSERSRVRRPLNGGWVVMIVAGLIAAVSNFALLTMDDVASPVVVVAESAPAGTPVDQLVTTTTEVSLEDPGLFLFADPTLLQSSSGQVTAGPLEAGVLLRRSDLRVAAGATAGAMSVPVPSSRAAGGLLAPGDRVDIIAGEDGSVDYVITDTTVLDVTTSSAGLAASSDYAVTIEVDRDQALQVAVAVRAGEVDVIRTAQGSGR